MKNLDTDSEPLFFIDSESHGYFIQISVISHEQSQLGIEPSSYFFEPNFSLNTTPIKGQH